MARVPGTFAFPKEELTIEELSRYLEQMYSQLAVGINQKPNVHIRDTDGQPNDTRLSVGDININSSTLKVEMLTQFVDSSTVTWTQIS